MSTWSIRKSGTILCTSSVPGCGYSAATLKAMSGAGLHLYCDGKRVKKAASGAANTEGGKEK